MSTLGTEQLKLAAILFTDIVGSTQLKTELGDREAGALIKRHHALIREILAGFQEGEEINTAGDSFLILFAKPSDAVKFALMVQSRLRVFAHEGHAIRDRIGIHVGEVVVENPAEAGRPKDLSGIHVDTSARVMGLALGGQILMTRFAFDSARAVLKGGELPGVGALRWMNHGPYELKGVEEPLEICQVSEADAEPPTPPPTSEKAHRHLSPGSEPVLGWRPALEQEVPGTQWVLEKKLGEGGFGEVWLGRHQTLKERRVFKFCFRADRVRSLKREVTLFRVLKEKVGHHPNIVGVQEVYFETPPFYIVMDYAAGQDLKAWSGERGGIGSVALETRLEIVAQVADALQAAHEAGVIHRDVKPSNILVHAGQAPGSGGTPDLLCVKLTDFGIGQVVSQEALAGMTRMGFTQTMFSSGSSTLAGTHLYMAPELVAGQTASVRSDIYSLGVVFYQLLVGDFTRPLTTDWARTILDPLLREDLEKCFAGNPEERFTSAGQLAQALRSLPQRQAQRTAAERSVRRRKAARIAAMAGIALAALGALSVLIANQSVKLRDQAVPEVGTTNAQAKDRFDLGKAYVKVNSSKNDLTNAVKWFEEAVELDPRFAQAYISQAFACRALDVLWESKRGWDQKALAAANKAIELAPTSAEAYVVRGSLYFTPARNWDATRAVQDLLKAIELNPKVKRAHANIAFVLLHLGFFREALDRCDQEQRLDSLDTAQQTFRGMTLLYKGDYREGLQVLEPLPEAAFPHLRHRAYTIGSCLFNLGQTSHAVNLLESTLTSLPEPDDALLLSTLAMVNAGLGNRVQAEAVIQKATVQKGHFIDSHHVSCNIGVAYALMGQNKKAVEWLRKSADDGNPCFPFFRDDPSLKRLRGDGEFDSFLAEMKVRSDQNRAKLAPLLKW